MDRMEIAHVTHGAQLYGTDGPASDRDIYRVFIPSCRDIVLGNLPGIVQFRNNTASPKKAPGEVDITETDLLTFLRHAAAGANMEIEMLFVPPESSMHLVAPASPWREIYAHRKFMLSKKMRMMTIVSRRRAQFRHTPWQASVTKETCCREIYHVCRMAEIATQFCFHEDVTFPLRNADQLRQIKSGAYSIGECVEAMNIAVDSMESAIAQSHLRHEVSPALVDFMVYEIYSNFLRGKFEKGA